MSTCLDLVLCSGQAPPGPVSVAEDKALAGPTSLFFLCHDPSWVPVIVAATPATARRLWAFVRASPQTGVSFLSACHVLLSSCPGSVITSPTSPSELLPSSKAGTWVSWGHVFCCWWMGMLAFSPALR